MTIDTDKLKRIQIPAGLPFKIGKFGHVVLQVKEVERSAGTRNRAPFRLEFPLQP